jgi:hypothetical protein
MTHSQSTTRFDRVFVNMKLYMRILQAREDYEVIYKLGQKIQSTFYPNGTRVTYNN